MLNLALLLLPHNLIFTLYFIFAYIPFGILPYRLAFPSSCYCLEAEYRLGEEQLKPFLHILQSVRWQRHNEKLFKETNGTNIKVTQPKLKYSYRYTTASESSFIKKILFKEVSISSQMVFIYCMLKHLAKGTLQSPPMSECLGFSCVLLTHREFGLHDFFSLQSLLSLCSSICGTSWCSCFTFLRWSTSLKEKFKTIHHLKFCKISFCLYIFDS